MNHSTHNSLVSFIWRIADDCLRDVYVRGKYRDVILPMVALRRLDTLLEPTKDAVLEELRYQKEDMEAIELDAEPLKEASGYVFFNKKIMKEVMLKRRKEELELYKLHSQDEAFKAALYQSVKETLIQEAGASQ